MARTPLLVEKIISGGQTGADRGALYGALEAGYRIGGWAPKGWLAEDGMVPTPLHEHLQETRSADYPERTKRNIKDADATAVLHFGNLGRGSQLTIREVIHAKKPLWVENVTTGVASMSLNGGPLREVAPPFWLRDFCLVQNVKVLNVAGPRESHAPGLQDRVRVFVRVFLSFIPHGSTS